MALKGTLNSSAYQGRYIQFTWTATQNTANNQSTISWTLKGAGDASSSWYNSAPFQVLLDGKVIYTYSGDRIKLYEGTLIKSDSFKLTHDSEGKKSFKIEIKAAIYSASYNCTGSTTFTLDTIKRKATITSANNFKDTGSPTMKYTNPAGSSAKVEVGLYWSGNLDDALIPYTTVNGTSGTKSWTLTTAQKNAIYSKMKDVKSKTIYYYVRTTIGDWVVTNRVAKTITIDGGAPTLNPTATENDSKNTTATGSATRWVKGYSDIAYAFNATANKGASIKSYKVVCGSKSATTATGVLSNIDSKDVKFTVTDSRGNTATQTISGYLVDYVKLTCGLAASMILETSTTSKATLAISGVCYSGNIKASVANVLQVWYRYKADDGDYGEWVSVAATPNNNKYSATVVLNNLDYQTTYTFEARVQDTLYAAYDNYVTSPERAASTLPVFDWSKTDFNFNVDTYVEDIRFKKAINHIYTEKPDGGTYNVFQASNSNGNTVLGYDNYVNETYNTNIYGNNVSIHSKNNVNINGFDFGVNKVLWNGALYMSDTQTIDLAEKVSEQPHGIALLWSAYVDGEAQNYHWQ